MSDNIKNTNSKKRTKKIWARRALTSTVVLSSLMSITTLLTANSNVYRPEQQSNGIKASNLKGKEAVNDVAEILNDKHKATSLPASGAANRYEPTIYKEHTDKALPTGKSTHAIWGKIDNAGADKLKALSNIYVTSSNTSGWDFSTNLYVDGTAVGPAVSMPASGWAGVASGGGTQTQTGTWTWSTGSGQGIKVQIEIIPYSTNKDTVMKSITVTAVDGSGNKVGGAAGEYTHTYSISGNDWNSWDGSNNKYHLLGHGREKTAVGDFIRTLTTGFTTEMKDHTWDSEWANRLVIPAAKIADLEMRKQQEIYVKLPDVFKVADKKLILVKANGDEIVRFTLTDEEVQKINSRKDSLFGSDNSWLKLKWDASHAKYNIRWTSRGDKTGSSALTNPAGATDVKESIITWGISGTAATTASTGDAADLSNITATGKTITMTQTGETLVWGGSHTAIGQTEPASAAGKGITFTASSTKAGTDHEFVGKAGATNADHGFIYEGSQEFSAAANTNVWVHNIYQRANTSTGAKTNSKGANKIILDLMGNGDILDYVEMDIAFFTGQWVNPWAKTTLWIYKVRFYGDSTKLTHYQIVNKNEVWTTSSGQPLTNEFGTSDMTKHPLTGWHKIGRGYNTVDTKNATLFEFHRVDGNQDQLEASFSAGSEWGGWYAGAGVYNMRTVHKMSTKLTASGSHKFTSNFGNNTTGLPSWITHRVSQKDYSYAGESFSNATNTKIDGASTTTPAANTVKTVMRTGLLQSDTASITHTGLTEQHVVPGYDATPIAADTKLLTFLNGDNLLAAAGLELSYRKNKLLVAQTIGGKRVDLTNLPEGFKWQYRVIKQDGTEVQDFADTLPAKLTLGDKVALKLVVTDTDIAELTGKEFMTDADAKDITDEEDSADIQALLGTYWAAGTYAFSGEAESGTMTSPDCSNDANWQYAIQRRGHVALSWTDTSPTTLRNGDIVHVRFKFGANNGIHSEKANDFVLDTVSGLTKKALVTSTATPAVVSGYEGHGYLEPAKFDFPDPGLAFEYSKDGGTHWTKNPREITDIANGETIQTRVVTDAISGDTTADDNYNVAGSALAPITVAGLADTVAASNLFEGTTKGTAADTIKLSQAKADAKVTPLLVRGEHHVYVQLPSTFTMAGTQLTLKTSDGTTIAKFNLSAAQIAAINGRDDKDYAKNYVSLWWDTTSRKYALTVTGKTTNAWVKDLSGITATASKTRYYGQYSTTGTKGWLGDHGITGTFGANVKSRTFTYGGTYQTFGKKDQTASLLQKLTNDMPPGMVLTETKVAGNYHVATRWGTSIKPVLEKVAAGTALGDTERNNIWGQVHDVLDGWPSASSGHISTQAGDTTRWAESSPLDSSQVHEQLVQTQAKVYINDATSTRAGIPSYPSNQFKTHENHATQEQLKHVEFIEYTWVAGLTKDTGSGKPGWNNTNAGHAGLFTVKVFYDEAGKPTTFQLKAVNITKDAITESSMASVRTEGPWVTGKWFTLAKLDKSWGDFSFGVFDYAHDSQHDIYASIYGSGFAGYKLWAMDLAAAVKTSDNFKYTASGSWTIEDQQILHRGTYYNAADDVPFTDYWYGTLPTGITASQSAAIYNVWGEAATVPATFASSSLTTEEIEWTVSGTYLSDSDDLTQLGAGVTLVDATPDWEEPEDTIADTTLWVINTASTLLDSLVPVVDNTGAMTGLKKSTDTGATPTLIDPPKNTKFHYSVLKATQNNHATTDYPAGTETTGWTAWSDTLPTGLLNGDIVRVKLMKDSTALPDTFKMDLDETYVKTYDAIADDTVTKTTHDLSDTSIFTNTFDHSDTSTALDYETTGSGTTATTKIKYTGAIDNKYRLVLYQLKTGGVATNDADWEIVDETTYAVTGTGSNWEINPTGASGVPTPAGSYKVGLAPNDDKNNKMININAGLGTVVIPGSVEVSQMWDASYIGITKTSDYATWAATGITNGHIHFNTAIPNGIKVTLHNAEDGADNTKDMVLHASDGKDIAGIRPGKYTLTIESDNPSMFELHGAGSTTVSFEMGLNVNEADVLAHVQPNVATGSGTGGTIDKMTVKVGGADFTTPDGMKFQFVPAAHDTADVNFDNDPSKWSDFSAGYQDAMPSGLWNNQKVRVHVANVATWASHYEIVITDATDTQREYTIAGVTKETIDGSQTTTFDASALGYKSAGYRDATGVEAPTTVITYDHAMDRTKMKFQVSINTGTHATPTWTVIDETHFDVTYGASNAHTIASNSAATATDTIGQGHEYKVELVPKDGANVQITPATPDNVIRVKDSVDVTALIAASHAAYEETAATWSDGTVTEGNVKLKVDIPVGVTLTLHNAEDGADTSKDITKTSADNADLKATGVDLAPGEWTATLTPTDSDATTLVTQTSNTDITTATASDTTAVTFKINLEVDVTATMGLLKPTFDNTGALTAMVHSADDSAFTLPTGVKYQYKQYNQQAADATNDVLPSGWTDLSAATDTAPTALKNGQKVQVSFIVDSTATQTYDLVLNNDKYEEFSVADGTVDLTAIDVSAGTIFDHGNSALSQVTSGVSGTSSASATITYVGPGSLNTINNKLKLVIYTAPTPATATDADWTVVDPTTYTVSESSTTPGTYEITGLSQGSIYYVGVAPKDTKNYKVTGINPSSIKVPGRVNVDHFVDPALAATTYTWTNAAWKQGADTKATLTTDQAIPNGIKITLVNADNPTETLDIPTTNDGTSGFDLPHPGKWKILVGVWDRTITTLDVKPALSLTVTNDQVDPSIEHTCDLDVDDTFADGLELAFTTAESESSAATFTVNGASGVSLDVPDGAELVYQVTERPSTDTAHDTDPSTWTTYGSKLTSIPTGLMNGQKVKVTVQATAGAAATNHYTTNLNGHVDKEFTIADATFTLIAKDMATSTIFDNTQLESIETGYQGGATTNAPAAEIHYNGNIDKENTEIVLYETAVSPAAADADWTVVDVTTYAVTGDNGAWVIKGAAITQGHDYKVGVRVKSVAARNYEVTNEHTGMGTIHTQLRQNVAPFFQSATYTITSAAADATAQNLGKVVFGTAVPAGVTVTITDKNDATNVHTITSTTAGITTTGIDLKTGEYEVTVASDDTDVTVLHAAGTVNVSFKVNLDISGTEIGAHFTPTAPASEGTTANSGSFIYDLAANPITPGNQLVYYADGGSDAAPTGALTGGTALVADGANLKASSLTPGIYWVHQELTDATLPYTIDSNTHFERVVVAQRHLVSQTTTFDPTKATAEANNPDGLHGAADKGIVHYGQDVPDGTELVLYQLVAGSSDDGVDASYEKVTGVTWTKNASNTWDTNEVPQGKSYWIRLEATTATAEHHVVSDWSALADNGWNAQVSIPKAVNVAALYAAGNFVVASTTVSATPADAGKAVTSTVTTTAEIIDGAKVTFHNKADTDATKDVTITDGTVAIGGTVDAAATAPGHGAGSVGIQLRPGAYTVTVEPVDPAAHKLFNVGTPAVMELTFKLDVDNVAPATSWTTVTPPTSSANTDGEVSIDTTANPIPPETKLVYYTQDPSTVTTGNNPIDMTKTGNIYSVTGLTPNTYWFGLASATTTLDLENIHYATFEIQTTIDASQAASWDKDHISSEAIDSTNGQNSGHAAMQFSPETGAPINQANADATLDASGNLIYTYTDEHGNSHNIQIGAGVIKYDKSIPTGTVIKLYSDAACTTLVASSKYDQTGDATSGFTWTGKPGYGDGLDHAQVYYLKLESTDETKYHVINNNGDVIRIPIVIDITGGLRHAPIAGKTDGDPSTHTQVGGKDAEFELKGTSGGADGHNVETDQVAWNPKDVLDAQIARITDTTNPLYGLTTQILYAKAGALVTDTAAWSATIPTDIRNGDSIQVRLKFTSATSTAIIPLGLDIPDHMVIQGLDKQVIVEDDFFKDANKFASGATPEPGTHGGFDHTTAIPVDKDKWLIDMSAKTALLPDGIKYQYVIERVGSTFNLSTATWVDSIATDLLRNGDKIHIKLAVKADAVSQSNYEVTAAATPYVFTVTGTDVDPSSVKQTSFTMSAPTTVGGADGKITVDQSTLPIEGRVWLYSDAACTTRIGTQEVDKTSNAVFTGLSEGTYYLQVIDPDNGPSTPSTQFTVIVPRTIDTTAAANAFKFISSNNADASVSDGHASSTSTQGVFVVGAALLDAIASADAALPTPVGIDQGVKIEIYDKTDLTTVVSTLHFSDANSLATPEIQQLLDPKKTYVVKLVSEDETKFHLIGTTSVEHKVLEGFNQSPTQIQANVDFKNVGGVITVTAKAATPNYLDGVNIVFNSIDTSQGYPDALLLNGRKILVTITAKTDFELTGATPGHTGDTATPLGQFILTLDGLPKTEYTEADVWANTNAFAGKGYADPKATTDKNADIYVGKLPAPSVAAPAGTKYQYHIVPLGDTTSWDPALPSSWKDDIRTDALHNGDTVYMRLRSVSDANYVVHYNNGSGALDEIAGTSTPADYHSFEVMGVEFNNKKWLDDNQTKFGMTEPNDWDNDSGSLTYSGTNIPYGTQIEVFDDAAHTHSVGTMVANSAANGYELTGLAPKQYYIALISDPAVNIGSTTNPKTPIANGADDVEVFVQKYIDTDVLLVASHLSITDPTADANANGIVKWTGTGTEVFPTDVELTLTNADGNAAHVYHFDSTTATAGVTNVVPGDYTITMASTDATHTKIEGANTMSIIVKRFVTVPVLQASQFELQPEGAPATYGTLSPSPTNPLSGLVGYIDGANTLDSDLEFNVYAATSASDSTPTGAKLGTFGAQNSFVEGLHAGYYVVVPEAKDTTHTIASTAALAPASGVIAPLPFRILTAVNQPKSAFVNNIEFSRNAVTHDLEFAWKSTADATIQGTTLAISVESPVQKTTPYLNDETVKVILTANDGFELVGNAAPGNGANTPLTSFLVTVKGLPIYHESDKDFFADASWVDPVLTDSTAADEYDKAFMAAHSTTALPVNENQPTTGYEYQYHITKTAAQLELMTEADIDTYAADNNIDLTAATDKASKIAAITAATPDPTSWTWHALADVSAQPLVNGQEVYIQLHSTDVKNYAVNFEPTAHPYHHFTTSGINTDVHNFLSENDALFATVEPTSWANDTGKVTYSGVVPAGMEVHVFSDTAHATDIGAMTKQADGTYSIVVPHSGKYYVSLVSTDATTYPLTHGTEHKEVFVVRYIDYAQLVVAANIDEKEATGNTNADAKFLWLGTEVTPITDDQSFPEDVKLVFTPVKTDEGQTVVEMTHSNAGTGVTAVPGEYIVTMVSTDPLHTNIHNTGTSIHVKLRKWVDAPVLTDGHFEVQPVHAIASYGTQTPGNAADIGGGSIIYTHGDAIAKELKFEIEKGGVKDAQVITETSKSAHNLGIGTFTVTPVAKDDTLVHVHYDASQDPAKLTDPTTPSTLQSLEVKTGIDHNDAFMTSHFVFTRDGSGHIVIEVKPNTGETGGLFDDLAGIKVTITDTPTNPHINNDKVDIKLEAKDHYELIGNTPLTMDDVIIHGLPFQHYSYADFVAGTGTYSAAYVDPVITSKTSAQLTTSNYDHGNMLAHSTTAAPVSTKYQYHVQHAGDTFDPTSTTPTDWSDAIAGQDLVNGDVIFMRLVSTDTDNYIVDGVDDPALDVKDPSTHVPQQAASAYHRFTVTGIHTNNDKFLEAKTAAFTQVMPTTHANNDGELHFNEAAIPVGTKLVVYESDKTTVAGEMTKQTDGTFALTGLTDGQYYIHLESDTEPVDLGTTYKEIFVVRNIDESKLLHADSTTSIIIDNINVVTATSDANTDSVITWTGDATGGATDDQSFPADVKLVFVNINNSAKTYEMTATEAATGMAMDPGTYEAHFESTDGTHTVITNKPSNRFHIIVKRYVTAPVLTASQFDARATHSTATDGTVHPSDPNQDGSGTVGYLTTSTPIDKDLEFEVRKELASIPSGQHAWSGPATGALDGLGTVVDGLGNGYVYIVPVAKDDTLTEVHYDPSQDIGSGNPLKLNVEIGIDKTQQFIIDHLVYAKATDGTVTATVEKKPGEADPDGTLADLVGITVTINPPAAPKTEFFNTDEVTMTLTALDTRYKLVGDTPTVSFKDHVHGLPFIHYSPTDFFGRTGDFAPPSGTAYFQNPIVTTHPTQTPVDYDRGNFLTDGTTTLPSGTKYQYYALPLNGTFDPTTLTNTDWLDIAQFKAVDVVNGQKIYVRIVSTDTENYLVDGIDDPTLDAANPSVPALAAGDYHQYFVTGIVANSDEFLARYDGTNPTYPDAFATSLPTSSVNNDGTISVDAHVPYGTLLTVYKDVAGVKTKVKDMSYDAVAKKYIAKDMTPGVYFIKLSNGTTETVSGSNYKEVKVAEYIDASALLVDANFADIEATSSSNTDNKFIWNSALPFPNFTRVHLVNEEASAEEYFITESDTVTKADGTTVIGMVVKPGHYTVTLESTDPSRSTIMNKPATPYQHYVVEYVESEILAESQFALTPESRTDAADAVIRFNGYNIPESQKVEIYKADPADNTYMTPDGTTPVDTLAHPSAESHTISGLTANLGHKTPAGAATKVAGWYVMKVVSSNEDRYHIHNPNTMKYEVITENEKTIRAYMATMKQFAIDNPTAVKDSSGNTPSALAGVGDFPTTSVSHDFKTDQYTTEGSPTYYNDPGEGPANQAKVGLKYPGTKPQVLSFSYKFIKAYKADDRTFHNTLHFVATITAPDADPKTIDVIAVGYKPAVIYIDPRPIVDQDDPSKNPFEIDPPTAPGKTDGTLRWTDKDALGVEGNYWEGTSLVIFKQGQDPTTDTPVATIKGGDDNGQFQGLAPGSYFATWIANVPLFNFNAEYRNNPAKIPRANFIVQSPVQGKDIATLSTKLMPTTTGGADGEITIKPADFPTGLTYDVYKADAHGQKTGAKLSTISPNANTFSAEQGDYVFVPVVDHLHFYVPVSGDMADKDETFLITIDRNFTDQILDAKDKIAADVAKAQATKEIKLLQGAINPYYKPTFAEAKQNVLDQRGTYVPTDARDTAKQLPDEAFYNKMLEAEQKAQEAIAHMLRVNAEVEKANKVVIDLWKNRVKAFETTYPDAAPVVQGANTDAPTFFDLAELDNFDVF